MAEGQTIDVVTQEAGLQAGAEVSLEDQLGLNDAPPEAKALAPISQEQLAALAPGGSLDPFRSNRYAEVSDGALQGDFDESDIRHPTLRIVNGSGILSQSYQQGTTVFADEALLDPPDLKKPDPSVGFRFVPIAMHKQFRENLTDDQVKAGISPRIVASIAEVEALGGTTQWIGDSKPSWSPSSRNVLLIELPEGREHPNFVLELDGKRYAVGVYYTSSSAFRKFTQVIFNASLTSLLEPVLDAEGKPRKTAKGFTMKRTYLSRNFWKCRVVKSAASKNGFSSFQPELRLEKETTGPEIRDFIQGVREAEEESQAPQPAVA